MVRIEHNGHRVAFKGTVLVQADDENIHASNTNMRFDKETHHKSRKGALESREFDKGLLAIGGVEANDALVDGLFLKRLGELILGPVRIVKSSTARSRTEVALLRIGRSAIFHPFATK